MNETVKDILASSRTQLRQLVSSLEAELKTTLSRVVRIEQHLAGARKELADLDAALAECGDDLAHAEAGLVEGASSELRGVYGVEYSYDPRAPRGRC